MSKTYRREKSDWDDDQPYRKTKKKKVTTFRRTVKEIEYEQQLENEGIYNRERIEP